MTDDKANESNLETDGGVDSDTGESGSSLHELGEEIANHSLSRRSALAGIGSAAALGSVGTASATDIHVGDPAAGDGIVLPGDDTRVIEATLESEDGVLDVSGGAGLSDAKYEAVLNAGHSGYPVHGHPQPSTDQEVIPGDWLSEFSIGDRVFTSAQYDLDTAEDHLFQTAGSTTSVFGPASWVTDYVDEFVPYGYTASDGAAFPCVENNASPDFFEGESVIPQACEFGGGTTGLVFEATEWPVTVGDVNDNPNNGYIVGYPDDTVVIDEEGELAIDGDGLHSFSLTEIEDENGDDENDHEAPADAVSLLITVYEPVVSSDICEVINPTLAFKVDSSGIAAEDDLDPVDETFTEGEWPVTASDVEDKHGDILFGGASEEAIIIDENGNVPEEAQGNGYYITYDNSNLQITFHEDRTHTVLPNSGWLTGVKSCSLPRGDVSPCYQYTCGEEPTGGIVESEGISAGRRYGRDHVTSGLRDVSQLGLQDEFNSMDTGNFVRISGVSDPDRTERVDNGDNFDLTDDVLILADNYRPDEEELNGFTAYLDSVSVFDIDADVLTDDNEEGVVLERQSRTAQASARPSTVLQTLHRDTIGTYDQIKPADNGFMQIPVDGDAEPQNEFQLGDPFKIENPTAGASDDATLLSRGESNTTDNIADLTESGEPAAFLSESDAYRELDLEEAQGYVLLDTGGQSTGQVGHSPDLDADKWGVAVDGNELTTPTQIVVGGRFNCHDGTPLEMTEIEETEDVWGAHWDDHTLEGEGTDDDSVVEWICVEIGNNDSDGDIIDADDIEVGSSHDGQTDTVQWGAVDDAEVIDGELCFEVADDGGGDLTLDDLPEGNEWIHIWIEGFSAEPNPGGHTNVTYYDGDPEDGETEEIHSGDSGFHSETWMEQEGTSELEEEAPWVDITHDERVHYEINENLSSPSTVNSEVDSETGVFTPDVGDASDALIVVDIYVDGCVVDQVGFLIENSDSLSGTDPEDWFDSLSVTDLGEVGLLDPAPAGEDIQAIAPGAVLWDDPSNDDVDNNYELDFTQLSTFSNVGGPGVAAVNHIKNGTVEIDTLRPGAPDMNGSIQAAYEGSTPTTDYECNPDYFFAAAGWPSRDAYIGDDTSDQDLILVSPSDAGDASQVDDVCLDDPSTIASTLEDSMNAALEDAVWRDHAVLGEDKPYEPSVIVEHDPEWHSARGYVIRSTTRVTSAFDQSVDVSSVEIESFNSITEEGDSVITSDDLDQNHWTDLEMQDIQCALGYTGDDWWNWVNAETVMNGDNGPFFGQGSEDDRYAARADPLSLAAGAELSQEYLGDNELSCNELELGAALTVIACEEPVPESPHWHVDNPNVICYYDSWAGQGIGGVQVPVDSDPSYIHSDRPGAPNMTEGELSCYPHMSEEFNMTNLPDGSMPRLRWRMCLSMGEYPRNGVTETTGLEEMGSQVKGPGFGGQAFEFYEAFDIVEVKDSIADGANPWASVLPETLVRNDSNNRGLGPEETWAQNVYGDRFDGISVRNAGSVDLDDVNEHTLHMNPGDYPQRDWVMAGMDVDIAGGDVAPAFPSSRPDLVVFYGDRNLTATACGNEVTRPGPEGDPLNYHVFTDNLGNEFWFGTGAEPELPGIDLGPADGDDDPHTPPGDTPASTHLTACGTPVTDSLVLVVGAAVSNGVMDGTLQYEVPSLYDWGIDGAGNGEYDYVHPGDPEHRHSATYQDRGLFVESHDDRGDVAVAIGEIVIDPDHTPAFDPCGAGYDCDAGSVTTTGLLDAISDWRDGDLEPSDLLAVISSWRSS